MKEVVCDKKMRPNCPEKWQKNEVNIITSITFGLVHSIHSFIVFLKLKALKLVTKVMRECWFENTMARLTALRIKKTLAGLKGTDQVKIEKKNQLKYWLL